MLEMGHVYDSVYSTVDDGTRSVINNLFPPSSSVELIKVQKQIGRKECGLFSCAISTALAFRLDPETLCFDEWLHLIHRIEQKNSVFPPIYVKHQCHLTIIL